MQENDSRAIALIMVSDLDSIKGSESIQSTPPNTASAKSCNRLLEKSIRRSLGRKESVILTELTIRNLHKDRSELLDALAVS